MQLHREATDLIEQLAALPDTREHLLERQPRLETLVSQYGIWNGSKDGRHYWYTREGELIGPMTPQLADIEALAQQLGVAFAGASQDDWFDLDKSEPHLEGTFQNSLASIAAAYGALLRHQLTVQAIDQVRSQPRQAKRQQ